MEETKPHIVIFPFMSKGHTIPLLHLARLLLRHRHVTITIYTTPSNHPFISSSLSNTNISIISLPFPSPIQSIESTDKLPSMSLFIPFINSTKLLQPHFEASLMTLPNLKLIISDGFLHWTLQSANKLNLPRLAFYGMCYYSMVLSKIVGVRKLFSGPETDDHPVIVPDFPTIKLTRNDLSHPFNMREPRGEHFDFIMEAVIATSLSNGLIVNSFYELEPGFVDHYNVDSDRVRAWPIGPLCLAEHEQNIAGVDFNKVIQWLDEKKDQGIDVLYIAFGTQAEVSREQMKEIRDGLERSNVSFLWVMRQSFEDDGFEERVKGRGIVVREWVDQREVLAHEAVKGFLSHCGWNSVVESICSCKVILAWPMMAEQHLNARMVVEEIKIGIRVETCDGSVRGFVKAEGLERTVRELMEGETGRLAREKAKEIGEAAKRAMDEGGSSWLALESLLDEFGIGKV